MRQCHDDKPKMAWIPSFGTVFRFQCLLRIELFWNQNWNCTSWEYAVWRGHGWRESVGSLVVSKQMIIQTCIKHKISCIIGTIVRTKIQCAGARPSITITPKPQTLSMRCKKRARARQSCVQQRTVSTRNKNSVFMNDKSICKGGS